MTKRYAIYATPPAGTPLAEAAASWLGRDAFTNALVPRRPNAWLSPGEIEGHTAAAGRYGFHATLKAPFRLAQEHTETALVHSLAAFCLAKGPVAVPRLVIGQLDGFFALLPRTRSLELDHLASEVVVAFDRFRAPANEAETARRNPNTLRAVELSNLHRWGYPQIFESFRFHMTLTGRVEPADRDRVGRALEEHFSPVLGEPFGIELLALFIEPEPGTPFKVGSVHPLDRMVERKTG